MRMRTLSFLLVALAVLLVECSVLEAQINRGIIEGIVTDPQGAVVPDVAVTITNVDTNVAVPTKTNSAGYYRAVDLVPGRYKARFETGGFSSLDLTEIDVPAGENYQSRCAIENRGDSPARRSQRRGSSGGNGSL